MQAIRLHLNSFPVMTVIIGAIVGLIVAFVIITVVKRSAMKRVDAVLARNPAALAAPVVRATSLMPTLAPFGGPAAKIGNGFVVSLEHRALYLWSGKVGSPPVFTLPLEAVLRVDLGAAPLGLLLTLKVPAVCLVVRDPGDPTGAHGPASERWIQLPPAILGLQSVYHHYAIEEAQQLAFAVHERIRVETGHTLPPVEWRLQ